MFVRAMHQGVAVMPEIGASNMAMVQLPDTREVWFIHGDQQDVANALYDQHRREGNEINVSIVDPKVYWAVQDAVEEAGFRTHRIR